MGERQRKLLMVIVEEYISSAAPVGSGVIAEKYFNDLSSATIRNDMAELEENGYIFQPHTSAGRIPTLAGYSFYLENFVTTGEINQKHKKTIETTLANINANEEGIKTLAKTLAELSEGAILVGFSPMNVYYTGISNLFRQPEFQQNALMFSMSEIIDHLDEVMSRIYHTVDNQVKVLIGEDSPFGQFSSVVMTKYEFSGQVGLIGILGPNRMNYRQNMGLIQFSQELLKNK